MLGPLPYFHRVVVAMAVILTAVASGAWVAHVTAAPMAVGAGATIGGLAGIVVAYALLHAPERPSAHVVRRR